MNIMVPKSMTLRPDHPNFFYYCGVVDYDKQDKTMVKNISVKEANTARELYKQDKSNINFVTFM